MKPHFKSVLSRNVVTKTWWKERDFANFLLFARAADLASQNLRSKKSSPSDFVTSFISAKSTLPEEVASRSKQKIMEEKWPHFLSRRRRRSKLHAHYNNMCRSFGSTIGLWESTKKHNPLSSLVLMQTISRSPLGARLLKWLCVCLSVCLSVRLSVCPSPSVCHVPPPPPPPGTTPVTFLILKIRTRNENWNIPWDKMQLLFPSEIFCTTHRFRATGQNVPKLTHFVWRWPDKMPHIGPKTY